MKMNIQMEINAGMKIYADNGNEGFTKLYAQN